MTDRGNAELPVAFFRAEHVELNVHAAADLVRWRGEEIQGPCEGIVDSHLLDSPVDENDISVAAVFHCPLAIGVLIVFGEQGKEDIGAADGGGVVHVGEAAGGRKGWQGGVVDAEEDS
ncbi:hypothetical protein CFC21_002120 [Triticum aestivum]|uniref:Uncharacterized protein n=3 Tax=Triticum TaxID=4564 RepID=A0A9R0QAY9_TRITD|nr:hypothetical protein TRIUR3_24417 [Triticum urartu]KAF6984063.1 hypothetical protein CFC21_002120 [Triticum aestivum]VAH05944.1 unnamed protein product [Triticum turgidum subsp. durum]